VELAWAFLTDRAGEIEDLGDGSRRITLDARLDQIDRRAVLAHELVHDERDILFSAEAPPALVAKEEALVEAETCRRLVPQRALNELVRRRVLDGGAVTWREVAEWFDVPRDIAERALGQLQRASLSAHPSTHRRTA